jgi:ABC-type phosphate transport system substrate-binding protein
MVSLPLRGENNEATGIVIFEFKAGIVVVDATDAELVLQGVSSHTLLNILRDIATTYDAQFGNRKINFRDTGSAVAKDMILDNETEFALTDSPLTDAQMADTDLQLYPAVAVPIAVIYNIPGPITDNCFDSPLAFSRSIVAKVRVCFFL